MKHNSRKAIAFAAALTTICYTGISALAADSEPVKTILPGDINADISVDVMDSQYVLNAATEVLAGKEISLTADQQKAADVDKDDVVSVKDAQVILMYYVRNTISGEPTTWEQLLIVRPENSVPNTDDTLTILCGPDAATLDLVQKFTAANPEYAHNVEVIRLSDLSAEACEAYVSYFAGGEDADLFVLTPDRLRDFTDNDDYTRPMTDLGFSITDFGKCYPYTLQLGLDSKDELKAVAPTITPGGYVYRTDLAEEYLGVKTPEEMQQLVRDWDTFMKTAETLKTASDGKTAMVASAGDFRQPWIYTEHAQLLDENNKLMITDDLRTFYDRFKIAEQNGYFTKAKSWSNEWYEVGQDGSALGYFFSTWCLGEETMLYYAEGGENGPTYGKYNITEGPSTWFWGGEYLALAKNANSGKAARDFIEYFVVNPATMMDYAEASGEFVNNFDVMKQVSRANPLLGGQNDFAVLNRNALNLDLGGKVGPYTYDLAHIFSESMVTAVDKDTFDGTVKKFKLDVNSVYPLITVE